MLPNVLNPMRPPTTPSDGHAAPEQTEPPRRPPWRRPWLLAALVIALAIALVVAVAVGRAARGSAAQPAAPPTAIAPAATPTPLPLVAHGQIMPSRQARVGTLGGGTIRQLGVSAGSTVVERAEIARVEGPTGTEVVTAPFGGTVANVPVHEGDTVLPGGVIAVVADFGTLQAETSDVDEALVGRVRVGQQVRVTVDGLDGLSLPGTVKSVARLPQADATGGQTYPVVIELDPIPPDVHAGMAMRVTFKD